MDARKVIGGETNQSTALMPEEMPAVAALADQKRESIAMLPADPLKAAEQIIDLAESRGARLRLLGGVAFKKLCPSASDPKYYRENKDVDLMAKHEDRPEIMKVFETLGYEPRGIFNRLSMGDRLIYYDPVRKRRVDVFFDKFKMCFRFNFRKSILPGEYALPITELVITKLQVVEKTNREYLDLLAAFRDFDVTDGKGGILGNKIAKLGAKDWRMFNAFRKSLESAKQWAEASEDNQKEIIVARMQKLIDMMDSRPKRLPWKIRRTIGEKAKWYEPVEPDSDVPFL